MPLLQFPVLKRPPAHAQRQYGPAAAPAEVALQIGELVLRDYPTADHVKTRHAAVVNAPRVHKLAIHRPQPTLPALKHPLMPSLLRQRLNVTQSGLTLPALVQAWRVIPPRPAQFDAMEGNRGAAGVTTVQQQGLVPGAEGVKRQPPGKAVIRLLVLTQTERAVLHAEPLVQAVVLPKQQHPAQLSAPIAMLEQPALEQLHGGVVRRVWRGACARRDHRQEPGRCQAVDVPVPDLVLLAEHPVTEGLDLEAVVVGASHQPGGEALPGQGLGMGRPQGSRKHVSRSCRYGACARTGVSSRCRPGS